ncbi:hypothetical protein [Mongoliitalea daihaiensis]|uniref:hypothetical protein n=1 Tax=Mongoliitalea daihaiensis TaxID=2782006 RepID=UPI001F2F16CF|nr:hypothetical protein [Mongoliitalea daihaiensis]UJP65347.1 hypothetical protein IPZ59_01585 [Mongoliitalea daihaiensis]
MRHYMPTQLCIIFLFVLSCTSPKSPEREMLDSVSVQKLRTVYDPAIAYVQDNFFVLRDYSSNLDIFNQQALDTTIQLLQQVQTMQGLELHGGRVLKKVAALDNSHVAIMKYTPDSLIILDAKNSSISQKIPFKVASNERMIDFVPLSKHEVFYLTYSIKTRQESKLYKLNLKSLQSTFIYQLDLEDKVADLLKLALDENQDVLILNPFSAELLRVDQKKGTAVKEKYKTPSDFPYHVMKTRSYVSQVEFFNSANDTTQRTRVVDFVMSDGALLLIVNQGTERTFTSRHLLMCSLHDDAQPKIIPTNQIPLNFSHDKHIFFSSEKDSVDQLSIVPIRKILSGGYDRQQ